jgi:signal transduction histidine kinase
MKSNQPIEPQHIEKQFFETISLILALVMSFLTIQSYLNIGVSPLLVADLILVFIGLSFFYLSRAKNYFQKTRYFFVVLIMLGCTYYWFWLNGISGSTPYAMIAGSVVSILIAERKYRKLLTGIILTWILVLVIIQKQTDWVFNRANEPELLLNNFIIFSYAIIIILHYIKSQYDNERERASRKNTQLAELNRTLSQTLTEKDEVIKQLRKTREELLESEKLASIGKLTAGLAHELNNPLNYIGGAVIPLRHNLRDLFETIDPGKMEEADHLLKETEELLITLETGSRKASDVVKNLVKISPEQKSQQKEIFSLGEIVDQNVSILEKTHSDINFNLQVDQSLMLSGNPLELRQVCQQLLHNCAESLTGSSDKRVDIVLKQVDKSMVLEVSDNGKGILPEHLNKVFDPFFTTQEGISGKGMGLYMSYSTVKKHSGQIKIESVPNEGTTVSVFLPLA